MMLLSYLIKYTYANSSDVMEYPTMANNKNIAIDNFQEYLRQNDIDPKQVNIVSIELI